MPKPKLLDQIFQKIFLNWNLTFNRDFTWMHLLILCPWGEGVQGVGIWHFTLQKCQCKDDQIISKSPPLNFIICRFKVIICCQKLPQTSLKRQNPLPRARQFYQIPTSCLPSPPPRDNLIGALVKSGLKVKVPGNLHMTLTPQASQAGS